MGSIPLVALQPVQPVPMPRTPLEAYARAVSLQGLQDQNAASEQETQQRAQAFPVQQQQAQATLESSQQQNQANAMALKERQTMQQTAPQYVTRDDQGNVNGFDVQGFSHAALAAGVSPATISDYQSKYAQGVEASLKLTAAQRQQHDENASKFGGMLEDIKTITDPAQRQQAWQQALMEANRRGVDISGFPPQAPDNNGIASLEVPLGLHAQLLNDAKTQSEVNKNNRGPVDEQELNSYLTSPTVPGEKLPPAQRTPASFLAWKAKQSPTMMVLGNMLGKAGEGSALDQAAERYSQSGELPAGFSRSPGTTSAIIQRAAELHPNANIAANKATFASDSSALKQVQKQFDVMNAFEGTALRNLDLYAQTAAKIPDLGAKFANVPLRMITGQMIGTDNMAALNAARQTAATEVAKVLGSTTGSGVLSDTQKKEAMDVINGNLPFSATMQVVNTLKQDMANRHQSYAQDIAAIKGRLGAGGNNSAAPPTATSAAPAGATHTAMGSDGKRHYTNAQGQDLGVAQ